MPSERSPLLQRVPVAEPHQRYPHQTLRRICTGLLVCACIAVPLLFYLLPDSVPIPGRHRNSESSVRLNSAQSWPDTTGLSYYELQDILRTTPDEHQVRQWSQYYTAGPHLAGKNLSQAEWTRDRWQEFGVKDTSIVSYDVYVNYPKGHRLALLAGGSNGKAVTYEANLEEDVLEKDSTSGLKDRVPTFHGYSASGNVTARCVFCNYGTIKDFQDLVEAGVELEGLIALVKYGGIFRGLKVKRAQELGMIGVVMYTDPGDDSVQSHDPEDQYPNGPARNPSSVQRGSTQFLSVAPGDPTTPGYPSKPGVPRQDTSATIPKIPSLPISYADALPLLKALNGHGLNATSLGERWQYGGLQYAGVHYNIGPTPAHVELNLVNKQEYVTTPMWNVIGIINGTNANEVVILGNHRDAWIAGGAGDPNSGSAAFNEVIRSFGAALERGWKPLRTIVLASWDGEEYGLIGSTEWVEEYLPWLSSAAVAYINVDVGTSGPDFSAAAAPLLNKALIASTHAVLSPNQTIKGQTVGDVWNGHIKTMGSGSDFTAFQDFAGIPCIDLGFGANPSGPTEPGRPVYHYHSNYDSFDWMDRFGDRDWHYHATIAKVWGLLAASLVESPIIPFSATDYADALISYMERIQADLPAHMSLAKLRTALVTFRVSARKFDAEAAALAEKLRSFNARPRWQRWWQRTSLYAQTKRVNDRYKHLERQFLYKGGLDGREWFKHTVFAPGLWTGYSGATFPGLVESLEAGDGANSRRWEGIIVGEVAEAARWLGS